MIKTSKADLIEYLNKDKYKTEGLFGEKKRAEYLIKIAADLPDSEEYLLVALEGISDAPD